MTYPEAASFTHKFNRMLLDFLKSFGEVISGSALTKNMDHAVQLLDQIAEMQTAQANELHNVGAQLERVADSLSRMGDPQEVVDLVKLRGGFDETATETDDSETEQEPGG